MGKCVRICVHKRVSDPHKSPSVILSDVVLQLEQHCNLSGNFFLGRGPAPLVGLEVKCKQGSNVSVTGVVRESHGLSKVVNDLAEDLHYRVLHFIGM